MLFGRAQPQSGVAFLDVPAVDVANRSPIAIVFSKIVVVSGKVPDSLISDTRLVTRCAFVLADGIVQPDQFAVEVGRFEADLDIL